MEKPDFATYKHKGNGELYEVLGDVVVKIPGRPWETGIHYARKGVYGGNQYVRTKEDFFDRFVRIENVTPCNDVFG